MPEGRDTAPPTPLSAVVITLNEERRLPGCLASLAPVVDEIVVVDSGSIDGTERVARACPNVRFFVRPWAGYAAQKNAAADLAAASWILSLDADEELSPELARSVAAWRLGPPAPAAVGRLTRLRGRWIRHGGWYPDVKTRLYRRERARWTGLVHEGLEGDDAEAARVLAGDLLHYGPDDAAGLLEKARRYGLLGARQIVDAGRRPAPGRALLAATAAICKAYVLRAGFLDGAEGRLIARANALSAYLRYSEARRLARARDAKTSA